MSNELRILASLNVATDSTADQPIDMSAFAKYTIDELLIADVPALSGGANLAIYTGPNKTGTRLVSTQIGPTAAVAGWRVSQPGGAGVPVAIQTAPTLYVHMLAALPAGTTVNLHIVGTDVP